MMIPILLIYISNSYLLYKTNISDKLRTTFKTKVVDKKLIYKNRNIKNLKRNTESNNQYKLKPYYFNS